MNDRRSRFFVDYDVQVQLLRQLALNWMVILGVIAAVVLALESYKAEFSLDFYSCLVAMWRHNASLVITLIFLAPFIVYGSIKQSHRFVGPMVTFRRAIQELGEGRDVGHIHFRRNDLWQDFPESFNLAVDFRSDGAIIRFLRPNAFTTTFASPSLACSR